MDETTQQHPFDAERITWIFSRAYGTEEANRRAKNVVADVEKLGITPTLNFLPLQEESWIPYYTFGESDFALENLEKDIADTLKAVGLGLNWGDLHLLSHACELGRKLWGEDWVLSFRDKLRTFPDHIATIEELWWLSLWHSPSEIQREVCLGKNTNRTVDWRFKTCGQLINLEVKLRPKDWKRVVDGQMYSVFHESFFEGISEKFPMRSEAELNLVGMTLLAPLDNETAEAAEKFLAKHELIDGIIFWSTGMADQSPEQFHLKPRAGHARLLFRKPENYYFRSTLVIHPWMDREKRRAKWLGIKADYSRIDGFQRKVGKIFVPRGLPR